MLNLRKCSRTHPALRTHQDSHEKATLQREIESRDRIIDRLIYELLPSGISRLVGVMFYQAPLRRDI